MSKSTAELDVAKPPKPLAVLPEPKWHAYLVSLEDEFRKRLGDHTYEFSKLIMLMPAAWDKDCFHFGQDKELIYQGYPLSLTQEGVSLIYLKGMEFLGEWIPLFVVWSSSWWVDYVQMAFRITDRLRIDEKVSKLKDIVSSQMVDMGFASYFLKVALQLHYENVDLLNHLDGILDSDIKDEQLLAKRENALLTRHRDIMTAEEEGFRFTWKHAVGIGILGAISAAVLWLTGVIG